MRTRFFCLVTLTTLLSCLKNESRSSEHRAVKTEQSQIERISRSENGVLIVTSDSAYLNAHTFYILNPNGSVFCEIKSVDGNEPSCDLLEGKILAYYPDYYIIHFKAEDLSDEFYHIQVGTDNKLLKKQKYLTFLTWQEYVLMFFCTTSEDNPLREEPSPSSNALPNLNYEELNFRCKEISGDWVKVICNMDCEGCPDNTTVQGWIRWRKKGKVIINQYYTC